MANFNKKPVAVAVGAAFFAASAPQFVNADSNPFSVTKLNSGYNLANYAHHGERKPAEGKCGEGKCGEGKCGGKKASGNEKDANGDGVVTKREFMAYSKAKFAKLDIDGDGKLSADEMAAKRCDHDKHDNLTAKRCDHAKHDKPAAKANMSIKAGMEGKCGEGKCGS